MPPVTIASCRRVSPLLIFPLIIHGSLVKALCIFSSTRDNLLYNCTDGKWQIRRETEWFSVWALASSCWIVLKPACSRLPWQCPTSHLNVHTAGYACNLWLLRNQLGQKRIVIPILSLIYKKSSNRKVCERKGWGNRFVSKEEAENCLSAINAF